MVAIDASYMPGGLSKCVGAKKMGSDQHNIIIFLEKIN